jgi:hypothetical protein
MGMYGGNRLTRGVVGGGGGPPAPTGYDYGSPAGAGGTDGGGTVVAQWIFDEATGNAVDEVNSVSCAPSSATAWAYGIPTDDYFLAGATGMYSPAPGIKLSNGNAAVAALDLGTDNFVVEIIARPVNIFNLGGGTNPHLIGWQGASGATGFNFLYSAITASPNVSFTLVASDLTSRTITWTNPHAGASPFTTYAWSKWRIIVARAANSGSGSVEVVYNGTSWGAVNFSSGLSGKDVNCSGVNLFGRWDAFRNTSGILGEIRVTKGTTTANSGGPNGG